MVRPSFPSLRATSWAGMLCPTFLRSLLTVRTLYVSRKTAKGSIFPYPCAHFLGTCHLLPRRKCCRPHEKEGIGGVKGRRGRGGGGEGGIFLVRPLSSLAKAADLYRGAFGNVSGTFCLFPLPPPPPLASFIRCDLGWVANPFPFCAVCPLGTTGP